MSTKHPEKKNTINSPLATQLSEVISMLQSTLTEKGDMKFTCTVMEPYNDYEDPMWGQNFVSLQINEEECGSYCDLILETDAVYRRQREIKNQQHP